MELMSSLAALSWIYPALTASLPTPGGSWLCAWRTQDPVSFLQPLAGLENNWSLVWDSLVGLPITDVVLAVCVGLGTACLPATVAEHAARCLRPLVREPRGLSDEVHAPQCPSPRGEDQLEILRARCESWLAPVDSLAVKHRLPEGRSGDRKEGQWHMSGICPLSTPCILPELSFKARKCAWLPAESRSSSWAVTSRSAVPVVCKLHGSAGRAGPVLSW